MKTFVLFCIVCVLSTGILMTGINMKNAMVAVPAAFIIWGLFMWYLTNKDRQNWKRKQRQHMFDKWLRHQNRNY